jgi:dTDP-4-amino-4,6-dideoxygalactose transaminase
MKKISWVGKKNINNDIINEKINKCIETKHFTNGGYNVCELQENIKKIFYLDENKEVLMVCNGASGLNALIGGMNIYFNTKLKWLVQSFTFPCCQQGILSDSIVIDIDDNMGIDYEYLEKNKNNYDGIVITNCFGCSTNIELYETFCKTNNKILLFDNAASPMSFYKNKNHLNYGNGCMVSLHHTKPIGFGEGGFIVFDKSYLESMKKAICFGYSDTDRLHYDVNAGNYKMSEISCIYIAEYLKNLDNIFKHHTKMIKYFIEKTKDIKLFTTFGDYSLSLMTTISILLSYKCDIKHFIENNIEAKKYYYPLENKEKSRDIFDRIICLPLNMDVGETEIDRYIEIINKYYN